ncbi:hypothetical protein ACFX5E_16085, partial [Flavobacterium sp. LS2P90]
MKSTITNSTKLFTIFLLSLSSIMLAQTIGPGIAPVNSPTGGFNIDGSLIANSTTGDWVDGTGTGGYVLANSGTPLNSGTTFHLYDLYNSSLDNTFGGGDKVGDNPNNWSSVSGTPNNKTDINNALIHFTTDALGNVWVVFAADRLSNSGNAYLDFEFLQTTMTSSSSGFSTLAPPSTGGRTEGDFLLTVYFESGVAKFDIQRWELNGSTWEYKTYFSSLLPDSVYAAGNTAVVPVPYQAFGANNYPQNTFIESAVNLTAVLGAIDPCASLKIKTIFVKSKVSTSSSASISDFFEPLQVNNITLGSADAGDDDTVCSGSPYTLKGLAMPSPGYELVSATWSFMSGSTGIIAVATDLNSTVSIDGSSATLRLTVVTGPISGSGSQCTVSDDVVITVKQTPTSSITGSDGPLCPSASTIYSAPASAAYSWGISGNGTIVGVSNIQNVSVAAGSICNETFTLSLTTTTNGCSSTCTKIVTVVDDTAPVISTTAASLNQTLQCNNTSGITSALALSPAATDNCSLTPTKNLVSDTTTADPNCTNAYVRVRTWNFTDGCGNTSANFIQTITVIDNAVPVISTTVASLNQTLQCNNTASISAALALFPVATDNCTLAPTKNLVSDTTTADPNCTNAYVRVRTWNFTDSCGNTSANFVQTVTVIDNTAPVLSTTAASLNQTLQCNNTASVTAALALSPAATDNCTLAPTKNLVSDTTTADPNCTNAYVRVRTWNFTDGCGNTSANFVQIIAVIDNTAPVISTTAASLNQTLQCNNTIGITAVLALSPAATDNCTLAPAKVLVSDTTTADPNCTNSYVRVRTWNFTDGCGNTSVNFVQTITVIDNTQPILKIPADITIECSITPPVVNVSTASATDNCEATPKITYLGEVRTNGNCLNDYSLTRTWKAEDGCGNFITKSQTIKVQDTTPPSSFTRPQNIILESDENCFADISTVSTGTVTDIIDNCGPYLPPTFIDGDCFGSFDSQSINAGGGNYFPFTISGFDGVLASAIEKVALAFETNQGKGRAEFTLVSPNGQAIILVGPYCTGGACDDATSNTKELYTPTFYPKDQPKWENINFIPVGNGNFTPNGALSSTNSINPINGPVLYVSSFENFTGPMNGDWFIYSRKQASVNGSIDFKSVCLTPVVLCKNEKLIVRHWTVSDVCNNAVKFDQVIRVIDKTAPTFTKPADKTIYTDATCTYNTNIEFTGDVLDEEDNCSTGIQATNVDGEPVANVGCQGGFTIARTWSLTDSCGNKATDQIQTITIRDNTPPTFTTPADKTIYTDATCTYNKNIEFTGDVLDEADNCSTGIQATYTDGEPVAIVGCKGGFTIARTWSLSDNCGNESTALQTITIRDSTPPTFNTPVDKTIYTDATCTSNTNIEFTGDVLDEADNCSTGIQATYTDGEPVAIGGCQGGFTIARTWSLTDSCGNKATDQIQTITIRDNFPPTFTKPADKTIYTDANCTYNTNIEFTGDVLDEADNCSTGIQATYTDGEPIAIVGCQGGFTIARTWSLSDNCGNEATASQTITILDNTPPTITAQASNITVECDGQGNQNLISDWLANHGGATASDTCSNVIWSNNFNALLNDCSADVTVIFTAKDSCGNVASTSATFSVKDSTKPIAPEAPADVTLSCTTNVPLMTSLTAMDDCSGEITVQGIDTIVQGDCANSYVITRTWTFTDSCSNSSSTVQTINVQDTTAPVINPLPATTTISCPATPEFTRATATDACGSAIEITPVDVTTNGACAGSYSVTRTWTAKDACGNSSTATQTINFQDTTAPLINPLPATATISCPANPEFTQATATDECGSTIELTPVDVTTNGACAGSYSVTRTWTATDACGNSSTATQTIKVQDTTAPVINPLPATTTISCPATPEFTRANATDACGSAIELTPVDVTTNGACVGSYSVTRTWTAIDACGNSSTATQTINVQDTTAPVIDPLSATATISCPAVPEFTQATATDACGSAIELTPVDVTTNGACVGSYSVTRTWTAIDACGNSSTATQTINVQDTTAPVINALPATATISCSATPEFTQATA